MVVCAWCGGVRRRGRVGPGGPRVGPGAVSDQRSTARRPPAGAFERQPHPGQHEHRPGSAAAFRWSIALNSTLSGLQLAIGFGFGSLALVGDALHNLGDVAGMLVGWGAGGLGGRPSNPRFTYGLYPYTL